MGEDKACEAESKAKVRPAAQLPHLLHFLVGSHRSPILLVAQVKLPDPGGGVRLAAMWHTQLSRQRHLGHFALRAATAGSQQAEDGEASPVSMPAQPGQAQSEPRGGLRP